MIENKHTISDLYQMQSLPLSSKIIMTQQRIRAWYDHWDGEVYVSFSGGKDSTVLLDIVRNVCGYDDVPAVFVDTGLEYPEIREFVKGFDNVTWLRPKKNFKQVIEEYGYPFISKEVSECVYGSRKYLTKLVEMQTLDRPTDRPTDRPIPYAQFYRKLCGQGEYAKIQSVRAEQSRAEQSRAEQSSLHCQQCQEVDSTTSIGSYVELANIVSKIDPHILNCRTAMLIGVYEKNWQKNKMGNIPSSDRSMFNQEKWKFMLDAPFEVSSKCCSVMKKSPIHKYAKDTGRKPMTAQMASESRLRAQQWLKNGCNGFEMTSPISNPMSFWTEQDVLLYIKQNNLPICSVYGEIVEDNIGTEEVQGQLTISDLEGYEDMKMFDAKRLPLKTTGCNRVGCMFCGYGCHLEKGEGRFERMKKTHPKQYDYIMRPKEEGGLNYRAVIDWINENGNLNIKY